MKVYTGSCHCGTVKFRVTLEQEISEPRHCDCSLCRRRSAYVCSAGLDQLEILEGEDNLALYQFKTKTAKHYFCKTCGIYTHHQRRSNPNEFGFNIGCIDGINPFDFGDVKVHDGVNHPSDV